MTAGDCLISLGQRRRNRLAECLRRLVIWPHYVALGIRCHRVLPLAVVFTGLLAVRPAAQTPAATVLLDQYAHGDFNAVTSALADIQDFGDIFNELRHHGQAWIDAGGPSERSRRELIAATVALEASRAGEWSHWKLVQHVNLNLPASGLAYLDPSARERMGSGSYRAPDSLYWRPPALLLEWGCRVFRQDEAPRPIERVWQLAALAVAERAEDFEFLLGSPFEARGNPQDEIEHLAHVAKRFPKEARFALAQGIALDWRSWPESRKGVATRRPGVTEAQQVFERLQSDEAVGAEARVRLGVLRLRLGATDDALKLFDRVDDASRDPYVLYLARYFKGQALEKKKQQADAERSYRAALEVLPGAQSASMALSALLFSRGARQDAATTLDANLSRHPQPLDPWRGWADADDRFWPDLIAQLRGEIRR